MDVFPCVYGLGVDVFPCVCGLGVGAFCVCEDLEGCFVCV